MEKKAPGNIMLGRILGTAVLGIFLIMPVLVYNLVRIQLVDYKLYQERAIGQQTRDTIIKPRRGVIYDANGWPLAVSISAETVCIAPANIKDQQTAELIARGLAEIFDMEYDAVYNKTQNKKSYYEIVKQKVDKDTADQVRRFIKDNGNIRGIDLYEDTKRYYPYGSLASGVIGFCNIDNVGQYGIEAKYESILKGTPGRIITAKNAKGTEMPFKYEQYYDALDGTGIVLTIDMTVQAVLEKHLETALIDNGCQNQVAGIVMNVKTGEIVAMADMPNYDLNTPRILNDELAVERIAAAEDEKKSEAMLNELFEQWNNKTVTYSYEPGSVFKMFTAAMAVEEKTVSSSSTFYCPGYKKVGKFNIRCWRTIGHGSQDFYKALQNSCNPAFIEIGQSVGQDAFFKYFQQFGLTEKTGIDTLGETTGIFFSKSNFNITELSVSSFGQTFKVTPIQLITAACGLFNGGVMMQPHLVKGYTDADGNIREVVSNNAIRQVVSRETSKEICKMLESVVSAGTGRNAYVAGYRVGGKTGTSEKRDDPDSSKRIASFLGFAPADDPQYAVLVLLDEPTGPLRQGGQIAAPVVGRIMAEILPYLGVEPVYTAAELAKLEVEVPSLVGLTQSQAKNELHKKGLSSRVTGSGDRVTDQLPAAGSKIPSTAEVVLYLGGAAEEEYVTVPSVAGAGMNYDTASGTLRQYGLYMSASGAITAGGSGGSFTAVKQYPAAGERVRKGSVVTVEFHDLINTADGIG